MTHNANIRKLPLTMEQALSGHQLKIQLPDGRNVKLQLKDGLYPGQLLRIKQAENDQAEPLILQVDVLEHPFYALMDLDIHAELVISPAEAYSGVIRTLPGPDGRPLRVTIPPGTREGDTIRITGVGFRKENAQGDMVFIIRVDENFALMQWSGVLAPDMSLPFKN